MNAVGSHLAIKKNEIITVAHTHAHTHTKETENTLRCISQTHRDKYLEFSLIYIIYI